MASSKAITPADPLEGFVKINSHIHHYVPTIAVSKTDGSNASPGLIVLTSWAFAQPRHIAKYLVGYKTLYPESQILLLQVQINNMLFRPDAWQMKEHFDSAAAIVKAFVDENSAGPQILYHAFSNGGAHSLVQLAEAYHGRYATDLPLAALVLDSTPGIPRWSETARALQSGLPKTWLAQTLGFATIHSMLIATAVLHYSGVAELAGMKLYRKLNDPCGAFLKKSIPRTYIHSRDDVMILSKDILAHAEVAKVLLAEKRAEGTLVDVQEFVGTPHVNHMASDPTRYWRIVQDTWVKAGRS